uniref:NADPH oxidase organizer 1 n=1 Tax=Strigops habroptila TaxID=2489341 RepID=A0A672UEL9_STRHB
MSCTRYPVDVKAVGLMQCRKQKNYMMFVSWSDQTNILIYRTFEDFKRFHKELKRKFPIESGSLKKSDRTLPRFKEPLLSGKPDRCLEILKLLETYSQELLKTAAKISQGEDVIQFFKAQTQDLDPSFPENSVVIMPSDIGGEKKAQPQRRQQQPSCITWPQASQSYRCIETFETKDTKNKTFKVTKKEIVEVLIKDMTGWWLVENADKQIAWFPASYLEEIDVHKDIQNAFCSDEEGKSAAGSLYFVLSFFEGAGYLLTKSPRLTPKDRNDSGFVESSAADLSSSLPDPDVATCVPKVPARPSAHEILQRCSTVTKRAVQRSGLCS